MSLRHAVPLAAVLIATLAAAPALATSLVVVPDADLARQAGLVVRADVAATSPARHGARVVTEVELTVREAVVGDAPGRLVVRVLGGLLPSGEGLRVWGAPRFARGEAVLLFLRPNGDGTWHVLHFNQGVFREVGARDAAGVERVVYVRDLGGARVLELPLELPGVEKAGDAPADGRDGRRFLAWVGDVAAGRERPADYFVALPEGARERLEKFTLLGDDETVRWFEFDTGGRVEWERHVDGQPGLAGGGTAELQRALDRWNDEPNTPIRLVDVGTTTVATGFTDVLQRDGNAILFTDLADDIEDDFSCQSGGTLAIGGVRLIQSQERQWRGQPALVSLEGEIIVNTGVSCFAANNSSGIEEVYTHELGHTLGLGHSCGDEGSPNCSSSGRLDEALMRAQVHDDGRGGRLGVDDVDGIRWLYDATFTGASPCGLQPGHGSYCRDCGPCVHGEGDCDRNRECGAGLTCVDDLGPQFGFGPSIDVCIDPDGGGGGGGGGGCNLAPGDGDFCTACGPCDVGGGDCDGDAQCAAGLVCADDRGAQFGFRPGIDVCVNPGGGGGGGGCALPPGHGNYCGACGPCTEGEGDCDRDADCAGGLRCAQDVGAQFGFGAGIDVCVDAGGQACPLPAGDGRFCSECGPCGFGQGDCDRDSECQTGLSCVDDQGAQFGYGPGIDVCI